LFTFLTWLLALNGIAVRAQHPAFQPLLVIRFLIAMQKEKVEPKKKNTLD